VRESFGVQTLERPNLTQCKTAYRRFRVADAAAAYECTFLFQNNVDTYYTRGRRQRGAGRAMPP